jgi:transcriptional regulator with XRE-family HTH domain
MAIPDTKAQHMGRKIKGVRELLGMKQETLATILDISQQSVTKMEKSATIEEDKLKKVAEALGVSEDTIKNFNEDTILHLIQNNYDNSTNNSIIAHQYNPLEKVVELYEKLLKEKDEMIEMYRTQLSNTK